MAKVKTISTKQLERRLKQGNSLHFWNVLTDGYFQGEMIPSLFDSLEFRTKALLSGSPQPLLSVR